MTTPRPTFDVRRGADRQYQRADGVLSRFSFPMAGNFDLTANAHGALMVHNDDVVDAGAGFEPHRHTDAEIVTWVVEGELTHEDSEGNTGVVRAGQLQRMSAGRGIRHSERNLHPTERVRVLQAWLPPDRTGLTPGYEQADLGELLEPGDVVTALSGRPEESGVLGINNRWVSLDVVRPRPGRPVEIAAAPFHHVFVSRGTVTVGADGPDGEVGADASGSGAGVDLGDGDALRTTGAGALGITATGDGPAEVLVWRMHAHF